MAPIPLVSIVITNYNYGRFLPRCIESALAQNHPRTEVVVVDDASTDESRKVIGRYRDRVVPVLLEENAGQGAAFNAGFAASRGDIVQFLDADDWLYPQAATRISSAFVEGVVQVQFRLNIEDRDGRHVDLLPAPEIPFDGGNVVPQIVSRGRYVGTVTSGNAFARSTLHSALPVPEREFRISADGFLLAVAPFYGRVASIEEPLGVYLLHGGNLWAGTNGAETALARAAKFRRSMTHDAHRYRAIRARAEERGIAVAPAPGLNDTEHLTQRMGSLVFDRSKHPEPDDWRIYLGLRGAWACRWTPLPVARRGLLAAWFVAVGVAPRAAAQRLILWRLEPASRPPLLQRAMRAARRLLR